MTSIACRKCGSESWIHFTTTAQNIDTLTQEVRPSVYLKREFRCATCDSKALLEQVAQLESIVEGQKTQASTTSEEETDDCSAQSTETVEGLRA